MKIKALLMLSALLASYSGNAHNNYHTQYINASKYGVERMSETSYPNIDGGNSYSLKCYGKGATQCQFSDGTCPNKVIDKSVVILTTIESGIMSGQEVTDWGWCRWTAIDQENFEYEMQYIGE